MKFKAKSMLAMAVLLSVMSVGTMGEAEWRYKVDDDPTVYTWNVTDNLEGPGNKLEVWSSDGDDSADKSVFGASYDYVNIDGKTVIFKSGTVDRTVYGCFSVNGNMTNNTVIINGGKVDTVKGGSGWHGNVTGNTIIINDGVVSEVYGGSSSGEVSGNKVIINLGYLGNAEVYGYDIASSHSDNTLQINNPVGIKKVARFDVIDICSTGSVTIKDLTVESGCIFKVDGAKIIGNAAITEITSATVESGAKLYVSNAVPNRNYKILEGNNITVSSWQTDEDMGDGFRAMYGLLVDTDNIINNANEFTIRFKIDPVALKRMDLPNIFFNRQTGSTLQKFVENVSLANSDTSTQATIINTMANMNSLANVQQGTQAVMAMATDALQTNIGTGARPLLGYRGQVSGVRKSGGLRNVAVNAKYTGKIETVEQGKSDEVMPTMVENEEQKYDKTVWANYIHSKKTIDGLKTGRLTQNSTIQYNGVTVGADLWSNAKGFGGLALTTAEGKTNSSQDGASVKNDTDYHGISLYQRYDYKDVAILFDLSYTHAKNDVTMSTAGTMDVTAKPKSDAYSAGVKVEYPVKIGHSSQLTPYTGVRYTHIHTDKYDNSLGISNDIKDQNLVNIPIGVQLKTEYTTNSDWKFGHIFEGGYVWNVGNRQSEQRLGYLGVYDSIDFDVTDRGEYFLKTAFTARHKDTDFELGYRYTKGDNTKDNKWNFNVTYNFGNANGMPYKSVLLGKIDLLESANKALRAENVALKAENERKDLELAEVKAENERKDLRIAELEALLEGK